MTKSKYVTREEFETSTNKTLLLIFLVSITASLLVGTYIGLTIPKGHFECAEWEERTLVSCNIELEQGNVNIATGEWVIISNPDIEINHTFYSKESLYCKVFNCVIEVGVRSEGRMEINIDNFDKYCTKETKTVCIKDHFVRDV